MSSLVQYSNLSQDDMEYTDARTTFIHDSWVENIQRAIEDIKKESPKNMMNRIHHMHVCFLLGKLSFLCRPALIQDRETHQNLYKKNTNESDELETTYNELADKLKISYDQVQRAIYILEKIGLIEKRNIRDDKNRPNGIAIKINYSLKKDFSTLTYDQIIEKKAKGEESLISLSDYISESEHLNIVPSEEIVKPTNNIAKPANNPIINNTAGLKSPPLKNFIKSSNNGDHQTFELIKLEIVEHDCFNEHDKLLFRASAFQFINHQDNKIIVYLPHRMQEPFIQLISTYDKKQFISSVFNKY